MKKDEAALKVSQVAELMGFSQPTIIRMFEKEPGVLIVKRAETLRKRGYRSIRIPRVVYERVVRSFTV
jgi:transcriptional regulator GlxA family with amidase domain